MIPRAGSSTQGDARQLPNVLRLQGADPADREAVRVVFADREAAYLQLYRAGSVTPGSTSLRRAELERQQAELLVRIARETDDVPLPTLSCLGEDVPVAVEFRDGGPGVIVR